MRRALDATETRLTRIGAALSRPGPYYAAAALLLVLAFAVRLPIAAGADDACCGHPDSWVYFHTAYAQYLDGELVPDAHRGSGWQLLLFATLAAFGYAPGEAWTPYLTPLAGDAADAALVAHTLSATVAVGAVAATLLLARELLPRPAALLAAALVALDPLLVRTAASAMSEPVYVPLFVLATMTVLRARRHPQRPGGREECSRGRSCGGHPAWLVATGALMALAHVLRVNGLLMYGALGVFAILLLRPAGSGWRGLLADRRLLRWGAASVATFLLVASPYLVWREVAGHGALDYGTNQRFWASDLWDLDDAWWQAELAGERIPRETMFDYFATHTWRDAAIRLWQSVTWQVYDLFGSGRYPAWEEEGGEWVGSPREESALTPLLAGLALVAAFTAMKRREWWFLPIALAFTFATFVWIYPLVRSVRYFSPMVPLVVIAAVAGWQHLATHVRRPSLVGTALFGAYFLIYGLSPILHVGDGLRLLAASGEARALVAATGALWLLVVVSPALDDVLRWARRARFSLRRADDAP